MTRRIDRRAFLTGTVASLFATPGLAKAPLTSLRPRARDDDLLRGIQPDPADLIERARLNGAVGFAVLDGATGAVLEQGGADHAFPPASVAKVMTAVYALDHLGPGHHFVTRVLATGPVRNGQVEGDLVLAGGGDPTLDTDGLADLAAQLREAGITSVSGGLKIWSGALPTIPTIDAMQPPHVGYNPAVSGLNLNYNRVHFGWTKVGTGYDVTMEARTARYRPAIHMARMKVAPRSMPVYTYADLNGRDEWTVARAALGKGGARWLPVRKPALYAGEVFQSLAKANGISLSAPKILDKEPQGETLASLESAPLRVVLRDMLKYSTNLTAEVVGLSATHAARGAVPTSLAQSARVMTDWAKETFGIATMHYVDHSGLEGASRISAGDMAQALFKMRQSTGIKPLLKAIPMRDAKRRIIKDHPLSVHAKTGTLNFVSGLAGFVDAPDGRELVFAIFAADVDRRASLSIDERERPEGGKAWNYRAKALQQALIERWGIVYAS